MESKHAISLPERWNNLQETSAGTASVVQSFTGETSHGRLKFYPLVPTTSHPSPIYHIDSSIPFTQCLPSQLASKYFYSRTCLGDHTSLGLGCDIISFQSIISPEHLTYTFQQSTSPVLYSSILICNTSTASYSIHISIHPPIQTLPSPRIRPRDQQR